MLALLWGCSHLTQNQVSRSALTVSGGHAGGGKWSDSLPFKRISWYHQWSLVFDLFYARLDGNSPFYGWISREEKRFLDQCRDHYIVMTYHSRSGVITDALFLDGAQDFGYEKIFLDGFDKQLRMHPALASFSLPLYKIYALCRSGKGNDGTLSVSLPGFERVEL